MQSRELNMYISKMRIDKNISTKLLSNGICAQSVLTDVESGKKDIDGFIFDNILQRLGTSEDGYICYHSKDKTESIFQRNIILNLINNKDITRAEKEIETYKKKYWDKNNLHKQFILHIESKLLILKKNDCELAYRELRQAVIYTVPEIEKKKLFRLLIGFNELFLIVECIKLKSKVYNHNYTYKDYEEIIEYIRKSEWENILKIRIYNKVICLISEYWLMERKYDKILNYCNEAIKYIQNTKKQYFISDILKFKIQSLEGLINNSFKKDLYNLEELNKDYKVTIEWKNMIDNLFNEYDAADEPYEWQPYYNSKEIYCIGEVIKKRRKMLKQSYEELSDGICDSITLLRIEEGIQAPRPKTARNLLKKLNISNEIYSTDIISDDYELHNLFNEINNLLNSRKYDEANKLINLLDNKLDSSNLINKQYFMHKKTSTLKNLGLISKEESMKNFEDALYITLPKNLDLKSQNNYFTKREILLMINIAITAEEVGDKNKALEQYEVLEVYFNNIGEDIKNNIISYETFSINYQSFLENICAFQKANEINKKIITECLKLRRGSSIPDLLYSQAYNFRKSIEQTREMQDFEKNLYMEKLKKSYIMACIMNDECLIDYIGKKIKE